MKAINIIKALFLGCVLYSTTLMQASQEYAKVLFDVPDQNLAICAHYTVGNLGPNTYFTDDLASILSLNTRPPNEIIEFSI